MDKFITGFSEGNLQHDLSNNPQPDRTTTEPNNVNELDVNELDVNKLNVNELDVNKLNVNELNVNELNVNELEANKVKVPYGSMIQDASGRKLKDVERERDLHRNSRQRSYTNIKTTAGDLSTPRAVNSKESRRPYGGWGVSRQRKLGQMGSEHVRSEHVRSEQALDGQTLNGEMGDGCYRISNESSALLGSKNSPPPVQLSSRLVNRGRLHKTGRLQVHKRFSKTSKYLGVGYLGVTSQESAQNTPRRATSPTDAYRLTLPGVKSRTAAVRTTESATLPPLPNMLFEKGPTETNLPTSQDHHRSRSKPGTKSDGKLDADESSHKPDVKSNIVAYEPWLKTAKSLLSPISKKKSKTGETLRRPLSSAPPVVTADPVVLASVVSEAEVEFEPAAPVLATLPARAASPGAGKPLLGTSAKAEVMFQTAGSRSSAGPPVRPSQAGLGAHGLSYSSLAMRSVEPTGELEVAGDGCVVQGVGGPGGETVSGGQVVGSSPGSVGDVLSELTLDPEAAAGCRALNGVNCVEFAREGSFLQLHSRWHRPMIRWVWLDTERMALCWETEDECVAVLPLSLVESIVSGPRSTFFQKRVLPGFGSAPAVPDQAFEVRTRKGSATVLKRLRRGANTGADTGYPDDVADKLGNGVKFGNSVNRGRNNLSSSSSEHVCDIGGCWSRRTGHDPGGVEAVGLEGLSQRHSRVASRNLSAEFLEGQRSNSIYKPVRHRLAGGWRRHYRFLAHEPKECRQWLLALAVLWHKAKSSHVQQNYRHHHPFVKTLWTRQLHSELCKFRDVLRLLQVLDLHADIGHCYTLFKKQDVDKSGIIGQPQFNHILNDLLDVSFLKQTFHLGNGDNDLCSIDQIVESLQDIQLETREKSQWLINDITSRGGYYVFDKLLTYLAVNQLVKHNLNNILNIHQADSEPREDAPLTHYWIRATYTPFGLNYINQSDMAVALTKTIQKGFRCLVIYIQNSTHIVEESKLSDDKELLNKELLGNELLGNELLGNELLGNELLGNELLGNELLGEVEQREVERNEPRKRNNDDIHPVVKPDEDSQLEMTLSKFCFILKSCAFIYSQHPVLLLLDIKSSNDHNFYHVLNQQLQTELESYLLQFDPNYDVPNLSTCNGKIILGSFANKDANYFSNRRVKGDADIFDSFFVPPQKFRDNYESEIRTCDLQCTSLVFNERYGPEMVSPTILTPLDMLNWIQDLSIEDLAIQNQVTTSDLHLPDGDGEEEPSRTARSLVSDRTQGTPRPERTPRSSRNPRVERSNPDEDSARAMDSRAKHGDRTSSFVCISNCHSDMYIMAHMVGAPGVSSAPGVSARGIRDSVLSKTAATGSMARQSTGLQDEAGRQKSVRTRSSLAGGEPAGVLENRRRNYWYQDSSYSYKLYFEGAQIVCESSTRPSLMSRAVFPGTQSFVLKPRAETVPCTLTMEVIQGCQLPTPYGGLLDTRGLAPQTWEGVNPFVEVKVCARGSAVQRVRSKTVAGNALNPRFELMTLFQLTDENAAVVVFHVLHQTEGGACLLACNALRVAWLNPGVRWVPLFDTLNNEPLRCAGLWVKVQKVTKTTGRKTPAPQHRTPSLVHRKHHRQKSASRISN